MTTSALRFPAPPLDRAVDQLVVTGAGAISARLDRLPATRTVWRLIILLSFGFFFELYDLRLTGYVAPGLVKVGIFTPTTTGLFSTTGVASFVKSVMVSNCPALRHGVIGCADSSACCGAAGRARTRAPAAEH